MLPKSAVKEKVDCLLWILLISSLFLAQEHHVFAPIAVPLLWKPEWNQVSGVRLISRDQLFTSQTLPLQLLLTSTAGNGGREEKK